MESVRRYELYEDRFIESKKKIQKAIEHQRKMNKIREKVEKMVLYHFCGLLLSVLSAVIVIPELVEARGYFAFGGEWMMFGVFYLIGYYGMKYLDEKGIQDDE